MEVEASDSSIQIKDLASNAQTMQKVESTPKGQECKATM